MKSFSNHNYLFSSLTFKNPTDFLRIKCGFLNMFLKYSVIELKGCVDKVINAQGSVKDPALCSHPCPDTICPCHAITTKFTPKCTKPIGLQHFVMIFCHVWCGQKESWVHIKHFSRTRHKKVWSGLWFAKKLNFASKALTN